MMEIHYSQLIGGAYCLIVWTLIIFQIGRIIEMRKKAKP